MSKFANNHIVIVGASEGVIATFGTIASRGRELAERKLESMGGKVNHNQRVKAFYVTVTGHMVELQWKRGNLNDVFLDHDLLPDSARISSGYRQTVQSIS